MMLHAVVEITLPARRGRGVAAQMRVAFGSAPPPPCQLAAVSQVEDSVLVSDAVFGVLKGVLHFMAQSALNVSQPMRTMPSLRSILKMLRCLSHFDAPSTRKNSSIERSRTDGYFVSI